MQIRMCTRHRFSWAAEELINYMEDIDTHKISNFTLNQNWNICEYTDIQMISITFRFYKFSLSLVPIETHYDVIYIGQNIRNDPLCVPYY